MQECDSLSLSPSLPPSSFSLPFPLSLPSSSLSLSLHLAQMKYNKIKINIKAKIQNIHFLLSFPNFPTLLSFANFLALHPFSHISPAFKKLDQALFYLLIIRKQCSHHYYDSHENRSFLQMIATNRQYANYILCVLLYSFSKNIMINICIRCKNN